MLAFVTPFEFTKENINGINMLSLEYEDVDVNHNTCNPFTSYEICNNTENVTENNPVNHAAGHEVNFSKEIQLVFWHHNKVSSNLYKASDFM